MIPPPLFVPPRGSPLIPTWARLKPFPLQLAGRRGGSLTERSSLCTPSEDFIWFDQIWFWMGGGKRKESPLPLFPPSSHNPQPKKGENYVALFSHLAAWSLRRKVSSFFSRAALTYSTRRRTEANQAKCFEENSFSRARTYRVIVEIISKRIYLSSQSISKVAALNVIPAIALIMIAWTSVFRRPQVLEVCSGVTETSNKTHHLCKQVVQFGVAFWSFVFVTMADRFLNVWFFFVLKLKFEDLVQIQGPRSWARSASWSRLRLRVCPREYLCSDGGMFSTTNVSCQYLLLSPKSVKEVENVLQEFL